MAFLPALMATAGPAMASAAGPAALGAAAPGALGAGLGAAGAASSLPAGATALGSAMPWLQNVGNIGSHPGMVGQLAGAFPGMTGMQGGVSMGSKLMQSMPDMLSAMNKNSQMNAQNLANLPAPPRATPPNMGGGMQGGASLMEMLNEQSKNRQMRNPGIGFDQVMQRFGQTV